jgi:hypothetical protein
MGREDNYAVARGVGGAFQGISREAEVSGMTALLDAFRTFTP